MATGRVLTSRNWGGRQVMAASHEFYGSPGRHTDLSRYEIGVTEVDEAVEIVQGLLVYDLLAKDLYGAELSARQQAAASSTR